MRDEPQPQGRRGMKSWTASSHTENDRMLVKFNHTIEYKT